MTQQKGATPDEWQEFIDLGLTADLLPVVSDLTIEISPKSKMKGLGKTPSTINNRGFAVGLVDWTQKVSTDVEVGKWLTKPELGICLQTRRVRAIDIDIADPEEAQRVVDLIELVLGPLPRRSRSDSGKTLLLIDMPGAYTKRVIRTEHGAIEFLATGQQCIVAGTHPAGQRYAWRGGKVGAIPEVLPAEFEPLWAALIKTFAIPGGSSVLGEGARPIRPRDAADIDDEVVDYLEANGWVTGYGGDGKVFVRCPWAHLHTSDSGESATSWLPAGVGGIDRGNFVCLHSSHGKKTNDQFLAEIGHTTAEFEVVEQAQLIVDGRLVDEMPKFTKRNGRTGEIEPNARNMITALRRPDFCGWRLGFDEFLGSPVIAPVGGKWRMFDDTDYFMLREALEHRNFKTPPSEITKEAVRYACKEGTFDSAIEWGNSLVWDGVPRIERFFTTYAACADLPYTRSVARYLWTALAGRCMDPGCQVDMVPVLISPQGKRKSSLVMALSPSRETFTEINLEHRDEQLNRQVRGKFVGEIAELRGLMTRDAESIKAYITRRDEEVRGMYREFHKKYPRRLLFIGTGNKEEFLGDETGERRWLPLRVGDADVEAINRDIEQLWAEGVAVWRRDGVQWRAAEELAVNEHHDFKIVDEWEPIVKQWLESDAMDGNDGPKRGDLPVEMIAVATGALGMSVKDFARREQLRIGKILRDLGYEKRASGKGDERGKRWFKVEYAEIHPFHSVKDFV